MSIRIVFLRDSHFQPVGCIAMSVEPGTAQLRYGVSVLNPVDGFDRNIARQLAIGRMVERPHVTNMHRNGGELSRHDVTAIVMKDLVASNSKNDKPATKATSKRQVPNRAVKAAKRWLQSVATLEQVPTTNVH